MADIYTQNRRRGGAGYSGGSTGSPDGVGIKKKKGGIDTGISTALDTARAGSVRILGVPSGVLDQDIGTTLQNTASNLRRKGLIGSALEGGKTALGEIAGQSTAFGKGVIEGGRNVLFGKPEDIQQVSVSKPEVPAVAIKSTVPAVPTATTPTIETKPQLARFENIAGTEGAPSTFTSEGGRDTLRGAGYNISLQRGTGSPRTLVAGSDTDNPTVIQPGMTLSQTQKTRFDRGEGISPERLKELDRIIAFEKNPEHKARLAENVALIEQRRAASDAFDVQERRDAVRKQLLADQAGSPFLVNAQQIRENQASQGPLPREESIGSRFNRNLIENQIQEALSKGHTRTANILQGRLNSDKEAGLEREKLRIGASLDREKIASSEQQSALDRQATLAAARYGSESKLQEGLASSLLERAKLGADVAKEKATIGLGVDKAEQERTNNALKLIVEATDKGIYDPASKASILRSSGVGITNDTLPLILGDNLKEYLGLEEADQQNYLRQLGII